MVGGRDFGRCSLASRLPTALWPVGGRIVLERLLLHLANHGITQVAVCSGLDKSQLVKSVQADKRLEVEYIEESLPVGTAGIIREAAKKKKDNSLFILFPSNLVCLPDIDALISDHFKSESDLTVALELEHKGNCESSEQASGIYICSNSVLEFIPEDGYFDIKEGLIPKMLRAGKRVHAAALSCQTGNFRDCHEYIHAVLNNIKRIAEQDRYKSYKDNETCTIWMGEGVKIDPTARITGQVVLMDNVEIAQDSVVIGPCMLGRNVTVGKNTIITGSVLWDGTIVGEESMVDTCVLDYNANLLPGTNVVEECVVSGLKKSAQKNGTALRKAPVKGSQRIPEQYAAFAKRAMKYSAPALVIGAFIWSYWPGLKELWGIWMRNDEYSSGLLVPFLAVYILWLRRQTILQVPLKPAIFGLVLFLFAQALRIFGLFFLFSSAEYLSVVFGIAGIVLLLFGWKLFIKVSTVLLFLFLMLPWPHRIQAAVSMPLQQWSTSSAVFCLEVMGFNIIREGNVIHIGASTVAVAEACNGLRMITAFFVISGLVALLVSRTWRQKLIVLISSLPVAFLCNTLRLTITAIFFTVVEGQYWEKVFHDFGGYAMMPLALVFIVGELWLIDRLTVPPEEKKEIIIARHKR
ncbi:MAG: exosortase [Sedimentisphaerales bacterium]|nr:exosortase [Sedimentisphaerales bacterium]